jgi:hypothetical protein
VTTALHYAEPAVAGVDDPNVFDVVINPGQPGAFEQQLHPAIGLQQAGNTRFQVFKECLTVHDVTMGFALSWWSIAATAVIGALDRLRVHF